MRTILNAHGWQYYQRQERHVVVQRASLVAGNTEVLLYFNSKW